MLQVFCYRLSESSGVVISDGKAQKSVATLTAEAEFVSVVDASNEAIHLSGILEDLRISGKLSLIIFVDNQSCFALGKHSIGHGKTEINLRYVYKLVHYIY